MLKVLESKKDIFCFLLLYDKMINETKINYVRFEAFSVNIIHYSFQDISQENVLSSGIST